MADLRESFPILEDASTGEGSAPHKSENGDASAGKVGATTWAFKDSSGNLVHPTLSHDGKIPVTMDASGLFKTARGSVVGTTSFQDIATITLAVSKTYVKLAGVVSCFRDTVVEFVQVNDAVTTVLFECLIGAGQYTCQVDLPEFEIQSGATGTQVYKVRAKNQNTTSDIRATISAVEVS